MKFLKTANLFVLVFLLFGGSAHSSTVPLLDTKTLDCFKQDLDVYVGKGKWTLVMFWATDCSICKRQKPEISAFHNKHKNKDAQVIGVAIDGYAKKSEILEYLDQHETSFPTLIAELPILAMNYEIATEEPFRGTPTYWFTPAGELVGNNPGPLRAEAVEKFMAKH